MIKKILHKIKSFFNPELIILSEAKLSDSIVNTIVRTAEKQNVFCEDIDISERRRILKQIVDDTLEKTYRIFYTFCDATNNANNTNDNEFNVSLIYYIDNKCYTNNIMITRGIVYDGKSKRETT